MADRIRLLPEVVANQIAAGEVVTRPAAVVKEMMENAIDAGAHTVKVNFRDGGKELIQIVDDGCGMSPIDARLAFDRHATSKINSVDDIYALRTFGFRGEALASIAAVAQVELRTRQQADELGTVTEINGGEFVSQQAIMCPVGSQFFVRNLFYNVPVRRRFLDERTTSTTHIRTEFQRVALCNPRVGFELYANDALLFTLPPTTLAGRIVDLVGRHIKQNLLETEADTSIARLEGYVGRPAAAKRRNGEQYLFVNGRYFKSAYLTSAILKAYEKLIPESAQPSFFLYLTLDPSRIDVNVHPQKIEVKFADEQAVWQIIHAAVRETLGKTGAVPLMDFDSHDAVEIPVLERGAIYREPRAASDEDYNPFRETYIDPSAPDPNVDFTGFDVPYRGDDAVSDASVEFQAHGGAAVQQRSRAPLMGGRSLPGGLYAAGNPAEFDLVSGETGDQLEDFPSGSGFDDSQLDFIPSTVAPEQQRLAMPSQVTFSDVLPLAGGYVAALLEGRLVVVDVRRARERIRYEEYLRMLSCGTAVSQQLLFVERLVLSGDEYALLEEHAVEFAALGFDLELKGEGTVEVKGSPADLPVNTLDRLIFDLLQLLSTPQSLAEVRREQIAAVMAREASKGTARLLLREEAETLLNQLSVVGNVSFSPSGKTILAEISTEDIRTRLG